MKSFFADCTTSSLYRFDKRELGPGTTPTLGFFLIQNQNRLDRNWVWRYDKNRTLEYDEDRKTKVEKRQNWKMNIQKRQNSYVIIEKNDEEHFKGKYQKWHSVSGSGGHGHKTHTQQFKPWSSASSVRVQIHAWWRINPTNSDSLWRVWWRTDKKVRQTMAQC